MKTPRDVEQTLQQLGRDWPVNASIVEDVMNRIESGGVRPAVAAPPRKRWSSWLAIAAALTGLLAAWWALAPTDNSLYAQALEAMENARTVHRVFKVLANNDQPAKVGIESWCERGVGYRVDLPDEVRLANTEHQWTYRKQDKLAFRSDNPDVNKMIDRELDLKQMLKELQQLGFERVPEQDEKVDGRQLTAYLLTNINQVPPGAPKGPERRGIVYLDEKSRIVRSRQETRQGDQWAAGVLIEWEYDVPIDRKLFEPDFGAGVKIVDAAAAFDQLVRLDNAVYQDERRGIIFAVHRLERFEDDGILVVSSVRGAPATLKKYPLTSRMIQLGMYFTDGPAKNLHTSPQGDQYFRIEMASVSSRGIDLCWWVLVPRGTNAPPYEVEPGKVKLPVGYTPVGWTEYGKTFTDANGILQHETWDAVVDLPENQSPPSLGEAADTIYADMSSLQAVPFRQLYLGVKPGTNESDRRNPDDVNGTEYRAGAERNVMEWHQRDLAFQLEGQWTEEMKRQFAKAGGHLVSPAIGVSYSPLVNDFTLADIAKRTSIERLYLDGTRITDQGLAELAPLKNLHDLSLINTPISDAGIKHLTALTSLKELYVHGTQITPAGIAELKRAIPGLKVTE